MNKKAFNIKDFLINYGVILIIIILVLFTGIKSPNFLSPSNLLNLLLNMSARLVIALGIALSPQGAICQQVVSSVLADALQVFFCRRLTIPDVSSKAESL